MKPVYIVIGFWLLIISYVLYLKHFQDISIFVGGAAFGIFFISMVTIND